MRIFSGILVLTLAVPTSAAWGEPATTEAPKSEILDIKWPPETSLKGVWKSPVSIQSPITLSPLGIQSPLKATKATKSLGCKWDTTVNGVKCSLDSTSTFLKKTNAVTLEKKVGSVCCKLAGPASWPPKPIASVSGTVDAGEAGTICYDLKSPVTEPGYLTGSFKLKKEIGDAMCSLQTAPVFPLEPKASIQKKVGPVCCTLTTDVDVMNPTKVISKAKASATYSKTFDTGVGPICCSVDSDVKWPLRPSGTATLKKKIGSVCANLEANTYGSVKCTFDSSWSAALAEVSEDIPKFVGIAFAAMAGAFAGSGITFFLLGYSRRGVAGGRQEPLLEA